jgi:protein transport protein SEC24
MMHLVPSLTVHDAIRLLYPNVWPISTLALDSPDQQLQTPSPIRASLEFFNPEEAYFIENGLVAFIWLGQGVPPQWINDVFNAANITNLDTEKHDLPERDNAHSRAVRQLVRRVNEGRPRRAKLFLIKQGDSLESWMRKFLVEDRYANNSVSYVDFLCQIHREIRNLLS